MSSPPPRLLAIRSFGDLVQYINALLTDSRYFVTLAALIIIGDAVLTQLVIRFVPCTHGFVPDHVFVAEHALQTRR